MGTRLIIIDDEEINANGVKMLIENSPLDVEICGVFYSSMEALAFLEKQEVDIVITDINMPELSGLELIACMKKRNSLARMIILTGFGSLNYAKEAMKYGVKFFLQKPCTVSELEESIAECIIDRNKSAENQLLRKKQLIDQKIVGESSDTVMDERFSFIMYNNRFYGRIQPILEKVLRQKETDFVSSQLKDISLTYIFSEAIAELAAAEVKHALMGEQEPAAVIYCREGETLDTVSRSFHEGEQLLTCQFYSEGLQLFNRNSLLDKSQEKKKKELFSQDLKKTQRLLKQGDFLAAADTLSQLLSDSRKYLLSVVYVKKELAAFCQQLSDSLQLEAEKDYTSKIIEAKDFKSVSTLLEHQFAACRLKKEGISESNSISVNLNMIIEQHYGNSELSLKWISKNLLFLNADYLSKVYLKETAQRFSSRLTDVRMRKAAEFLREGYKVYEVAHMVGYGNTPDYFGQAFKKSFAVTPKKFAELKE